MTPQTQAASLESPEYLRISLAAAMTLGIAPGWFYRNASLRCINLLMTYDEGCAANCSYCGLQRHREGSYEGKSFIRVPWPVISLDEVIARSRERLSVVKRVCLSTITHPRMAQDARVILERLHQQLPEAPISVLSNPTLLTREDLEFYRGRRGHATHLRPPSRQGRPGTASLVPLLALLRRGARSLRAEPRRNPPDCGIRRNRRGDDPPDRPHPAGRRIHTPVFVFPRGRLAFGPAPAAARGPVPARATGALPDRRRPG
jgi:hypothetical protein